MTIATHWLWPLGCLALLGAIHCVFWAEDVARAGIRTLAEALDRWL